ncbi:MAG: M1 family metallopeptidase [Flavisolibacter sp.]
MLKGLLVLLIFTSLQVWSQEKDVLHYQYSLLLTDQSDVIEGSAKILLISRSKDTVIRFDLAGREKGKGMEVSSVKENDKVSRRFIHQGNQLLISMPSIRIGDTASLTIRYKGIPADGLIISKNKHGDRTFFSDNWPTRAQQWIPCNDRPDDKASFEFFVSAPAHYSVISNGVKISEQVLKNGMKQTHWREVIPQPTKVMVIGVARFAVKQYQNAGSNLPVSAWVYPQDSIKGFYDYAVTPAILDFFTSYIGPYPYQKLANVQSTTIFGGMENASAIFYAENSVTGDRESEDVMAHEIAHQWFGNMASEKSFQHLWLSEGFATYLTNLYWEQKYGQEKFRERLEKDRKEVIEFAKKHQHGVVDSSCNNMQLLNTNSYQKGGWVLHMLRREVGDKDFQNILRTYYQQYSGGNADTRDFEAVAEKVSGKELTWFFDQWLYRAGIPELEIETSIGNGIFHFFVKQKGPVYRFTLGIDFIMEDGEYRKESFEVTGESSEFKLPVKGTSVKFSIDPDVNLLYELKN